MRKTSNNIEKYQKWNKIWFKDAAIQDTFDYLVDDVAKNGITVMFRGQELLFNGLNKKELELNFQFVNDLSDKNWGRYIQEINAVQLNIYHKNDAAIMYETINHEFRHKTHHALIQHIDKYKDSPTHYQYLNILKHEINNNCEKMGTFGFEFTKTAYIHIDMADALLEYYNHVNDDETKNTIVKELNVVNALYKMQLMEREAFELGIEAVESINLERLRKHEDEKIQWKNTISNYFNLGDISYERICDIIDNAKENIILGQQPKNDIEAAFTYKISALLNAQNDPRLQQPAQEGEQYLKDCDPEIVADRLKNSYDRSFVDIRYETGDNQNIDLETIIQDENNKEINLDSFCQDDSLFMNFDIDEEIEQSQFEESIIEDYEL